MFVACCLKHSWENTWFLPKPDPRLKVSLLLLRPPTVTSHSATKRPVEENRKSPLSTDRWATAAQPPRLGGANWTAALRCCARGSPEGGHSGQTNGSDWRQRLKAHGQGHKEKNEGKSLYKDACKGKNITDGHMNIVYAPDSSCAYMNQVVGIQQPWLEGVIFFQFIV